MAGFCCCFVSSLNKFCLLTTATDDTIKAHANRKPFFLNPKQAFLLFDMNVLKRHNWLRDNYDDAIRSQPWPTLTTNELINRILSYVFGIDFVGSTLWIAEFFGAKWKHISIYFVAFTIILLSAIASIVVGYLCTKLCLMKTK